MIAVVLLWSLSWKTFGPILKWFEPLFHILAAYLSFFRSKMNDSANIEIFYSDDESDDGESANQVT